MALSHNVLGIYRIVQVVGELLRYAIGSENGLVTIEDELKHTRNYLFIQEQRFGGRFEVSIAVDDRLLACAMPKFTLQPIVENSFEHGLQRQMGAWRLEIRLIRAGGHILAMVKDNGCGMTRDKLTGLRAALSGRKSPEQLAPEGKPRKKQSGIGLLNVHARLRLHFGGKHGIRLFSSPGQGTLVVLVFPPVDAGRKEAGGK
jgi:two-component system sensor histidine kinase YesM